MSLSWSPGNTAVSHDVYFSENFDNVNNGARGTKDWSVQTNFNLGTGAIAFWHGGSGQILYDQWVKLKYIVDLDNNTVEEYYNGELMATDVWDDNDHGTLGVIDLYGNNASSIYYDDIRLYWPPEPAP